MPKSKANLRKAAKAAVLKRQKARLKRPSVSDRFRFPGEGKGGQKMSPKRGFNKRSVRVGKVINKAEDFLKSKSKSPESGKSLIKQMRELRKGSTRVRDTDRVLFSRKGALPKKPGLPRRGVRAAGTSGNIAGKAGSTMKKFRSTAQGVTGKQIKQAIGRFGKLIQAIEKAIGPGGMKVLGAVAPKVDPRKLREKIAAKKSGA